MNLTDLRIYLGTRETETYGANNDWTPAANLTLVYSSNSSSIASAVGWETYDLGQPFYYDGTSNLVVVVAKKASGHTSQIQYCYTAATDKDLYVGSTDNPNLAEYPSAVYGTRSAYRPTIQFDFGTVVPNVDTLHLTIHHGAHTTMSETAYDSYTWTAGDG